MTLYPVPDLTVELAWDSPDAASPTWLDISDRVRALSPVTMTRGRSDERSDGNQPGSLSFTIDNQDGYFTPGRSGSPYYPNILPWRRVRVSLSATSTVWLFYGFVQQWQVSWDAPAVPVVQVQAVDSLALLGRRSLASVVAEAIRADSPWAYFPLGEPEGASEAFDDTGGRSLSKVTKPGTTGTLVFGGETGLVGDAGTGAVFTQTASGAPSLRRTGARSATSWTYELWVSIASLTTFTTLLAEGNGTLAGYLAVDANGYPSAGYGSTELFGPGGVSLSGATPIKDSRMHHLAAVFTPTQVELFVDGVSQGTDSGTVLPPPSPLVIGDVSMAIPGAGVFTVAHAAIYDTALTGTQIAAHYHAGADGFAGDTTYDRINRWCGWVGVTVTNEGTGEGETLAHIPTEGRTVLDCVADALRTDYGSVLLAARDARALEFTDRTTRYDATSGITLDCALDQVDADLAVLMDPTYVASRVTATTPAGTFTVTDAATEATYGELGMDVQVFPASDGYARSLAEGLGRVAASPVPRLPTVTTDLLVMALDTLNYDPTAIPEVGALVSLVNLPDTAPEDAMDVFVEGITETVTAHQWTRSCSLSPGYPWQSTWKVQDATRGEIQAGYVIAL